MESSFNVLKTEMIHIKDIHIIFITCQNFKISLITLWIHIIELCVESN